MRFCNSNVFEHSTVSTEREINNTTDKKRNIPLIVGQKQNNTDLVNKTVITKQKYYGAQTQKHSNGKKAILKRLKGSEKSDVSNRV